MAYFSRFPLMVYDVAGNENYKLLPDILKRVKLRSGLRSGSFLFDAYDVIDGERPEAGSYTHLTLPTTPYV